MKTNSPFRALPTVMAAVTLALVSLAASADTDIDERLDAAPNGVVEVSNTAGEVVVSGWAEPVVHVTGSLGDGVERLEFARDGERVIVEVVIPTDRRNVDGSELSIRVPAGSSLRVDAVSASIEVTAVEGRQDLHTVSGDVTTAVFGDELEAETVSGDLDVTGRNASIFATLRTVSGDIETRGVSGELEASTVSGDIEAEAEMLSRARLNTTNGRIVLASGLAPEGRFDLSTTNGRVEVMLDHDRDLDVNAQTFSGSIDNCFGVEEAKSRYTPERTLRFQTGEGNRKVRIRTMVGRIELCANALSR